MPSIERLLRPRSVAIVGASATVGALGHSVLTNIERSGFSGSLHLVNPNRSAIGGRPCVSSVEALPAGIDCAIFAIPATAVLATARACGAAGIGGVIVFSAGFAETGDAGAAAQAELARIGDEFDMAIEGPNCLGIVNYVDVVPLTFVSSPLVPLGGRAGIGIVSQSGAMAAVLSVDLLARGLGLSFTVSTGNEAHTGVEDYLAYLLDDPHTKLVTMLVEQFRNPARFLELAREARARGVPIVLLHPGRSAAARASAQTHTGALAGDWLVMRTQVERAGVVVVETLEELTDVSEIAMRCAPATSGGAVVLAESGAFKALALDYCERVALPLPTLSAATQAALTAVLPSFVTPTNPLDLTAQGLVDRDLYRNTLPPLLADDGFGCVVLAIIMTDAATCDLKMPPILEALAAVRATKPIVFAALDGGADVPASYVERLRALGVPFFESPERAFRAIARVREHADRAARGVATTIVPSVDLRKGTLPEYLAKAVLGEIGIQVGAGRLARNCDEALAAAAAVGYPVVLKAQSAELPHKTEAGGVVLNLRDEAALRAGWAEVEHNVSVARPQLALDGVLVEPMAPRGTELIVGGRNDPDWGAVLLVGFGGILAEAIRDTRLFSADLRNADIEAELLHLQSAQILRGYRGSPALALAAVADVVARIGALLRARPEIVEIEINPLVVYPDGVLALDALMVVAPDAAES